MKQELANRWAKRTMRRTFLKLTGLAAASGLVTSAGQRLWAATTASNQFQSPGASPKRRPDLLDEKSAKGLEVLQLTSDPDVPSSHLYMEAQIFTPDSKRFVLHRSAHAHGSGQRDPEHQYLLCDLANRCALQPLTDELGVTGASVSPDGKFVYYFVNDTEVGSGKLTLKRVRLEGTDRQTIVVVDSPARPVSSTPTNPVSCRLTWCVASKFPRAIRFKTMSTPTI